LQREAHDLTIDVQLAFASRVQHGFFAVMPALARLLLQHPGLTAEMRLSDQLCGPIKDGMDAVVRIMPLSDSRLTAKQIGLQHLVACASPDYLSRHGTPVHPLRLEEQTFVAFRNPASGRERPLQFAVNGQVLDIRPPYRILTNDGECMVEATKRGVGLAQVPAYMTADQLARGTLVEMLVAFKPRHCRSA
jgi:DNA-binding transcriptional LysR family regulator